MKSGWAGSVLHEMSIVFANNPYIVIGLSNLGDKGNYQEFLIGLMICFIIFI